MCDCYQHRCFVCGEDIDIHLANFSTGRDEVAIFHKECLDKVMKVFKARDDDLRCDYYDMDKDVVIIPLTQNALDNQEGNIPNC